MKITKRQLKKIIKEEKAKLLAEQKVRRLVRRQLSEMNRDAMMDIEARERAGDFTYATDTRSPQRPAEWMKWGESLGLDAERDRSGQVIFYTDDAAIADDAARAGADVQRDNMGQFVIYTG